MKQRSFLLSNQRESSSSSNLAGCCCYAKGLGKSAKKDTKSPANKPSIKKTVPTP